MSAIRIPYNRPPITTARPTREQQQFVTNMGRMLEGHIRKWQREHHANPATIALHYQPKTHNPDDKERLALTHKLLGLVIRAQFPQATLKPPVLHDPRPSTRPVWLDIQPTQNQYRPMPPRPLLGPADVPGKIHTLGMERGIPWAVALGTASYCGYIQVPDDHPWINPELYPDEADIPASVHGGITYHHGLILGFDTAHTYDAPHPHARAYQQLKAVYDEICTRVNREPQTPWTPGEVVDETVRFARKAEHAYQQEYQTKAA